MGSFWTGVCVGLGALLLPGGFFIALAWLFAGDGCRYSVKCLTCGAFSGDRRYEWTATRWANKHARQRPECAKRTMTGNRKVMR